MKANKETSEKNKILIVDDSPSIQKVLKFILITAGYQVNSAMDGESALAEVEANLPDLIIMDVMMPGMNGYEVCSALKSKSHSRDVPVLFISSFTDVIDKVKGFEVGGVDFVTKPFEKEEVIARVRTHLSLRILQKELENANKLVEERVKQRTAELTQAIAELEKFSYSISHELRSPLRAFNGYSQFLLEDKSIKLNDTAVEYLTTIHNESVRMASLIEDLQMLSGIVRQDFTPEPVDFSSLAEELGKQVGSQHPQNKVQLVVEPGISVTADPKMLSSLLQHLLDNAWKFTLHNEQARIEVGREEKEGKAVYYVKDNGIGFKMQYAQQIFLPFHRLHKIGEYSGNGIGLAIATKIVHRHGGEIWVESTPSQGTSFFFTLG
jgi:two-component system sensor histidine kinase/response regulator